MSVFVAVPPFDPGMDQKDQWLGVTLYSYGKGQKIVVCFHHQSTKHLQSKSKSNPDTFLN
jgi:hypothetical protein